LQNINKKNLYKIIFLVITLSIIISLTGCDWLSGGIWNIFDPKAQIMVNYTEVNLENGSISLEIYSLNQVEFIGTGFEYNYYAGTTKIDNLHKMVGATFYVAPSTSPGTPGDITTITDLPLYFQKVLDYLNSNPYLTEITCTINLIGTDGAGHDISKSVTVDLPAIQPGIDITLPTAVIATTPTDTAGTIPFTIMFDASASTDDRGIASYNWTFGDGSSGMGITANHIYDNPGIYIVTLTVTDFFGNEGFTNIIITANEPEAPTAIIATVPDPPTGSSPLKVYFDAYDSTSEIGIVSYYWEFGDGATGTGITTNHTYNTPDIYLVYLTVTDSNGYMAYDSVEVEVGEEEETVPEEVVYKVTGTATSVNITLSNSTGGTEQYGNVSLPKVYSYTTFSDNFLYISAQNNGPSGTVDVECYYKGELKDSAHSEGGYVIATASYYVTE